MNREKPSRLLERHRNAQTEMDNNRQLFEDCYDYLSPFRNTYNDTNKQHTRNTKQYDSTAAKAAADFVDTMQSGFTPNFVKWSELKAGVGWPEAKKVEVNKSFEVISETLYQIRNASNFATSSAEMYWQLGIGTGVMFILEGDTLDRPINYKAVPIEKVSIEDGLFGDVGALYMRHKIKPGHVNKLWKKAKPTASITEAARDFPDKEIELVECFYYSYDDYMWYQDVIYKGEKEEATCIFEDQFTEAPFVAPRWLKIPGMATGIGVFMMAMADIKTLNKMKELMLQLMALNVFGVYTVANTGTMNPNTAKIRPGAFIPVERNGTQNPSIAPLPRAGDFQIQEFMINEIKDQIKAIMHNNRLPGEAAPVRSAFEISQRIKEGAVNIGAAYGRLVYEYIVPMHRRELAILSRKGLVQLPEGFAINNFYSQVQVVSPIAQSQQLEDVQKFVQSYQIMQGVSPEVAMMAWEIEKLPQWLTDKMGAPSSLLRSEADQAKLKEGMAQIMVNQQQQAAQQQQMQ